MFYNILSDAFYFRKYSYALSPIHLFGFLDFKTNFISIKLIKHYLLWSSIFSLIKFDEPKLRLIKPSQVGNYAYQTN